MEVNAFSTPEPFEPLSLQTFIVNALVLNNRSDMISEFMLDPFSINVLSVERTLIEKILGMIKDSYHETPTTQLANRIRHLYDIHQILQHKQYRDFVTGSNFRPLCEICIRDDQTGFLAQARYLEKPLTEAPLFSSFNDWMVTLKMTYTGVFSDLVYGDLPPIEAIGDTLQFVKKHL